MNEASQQLASLHELVKKISEKISESHSDVAAQLRELITCHHGTSGLIWLARPGPALETNHDGAMTSSVSICDTTHQSTGCSLPTLSSNATSLEPPDDVSSIRSIPSSLSIRSVRSQIPLWGEELKNSRPYKRLWRRGVDLGSSSVFSKDSRATSTKGDTWSMLSDMSLGDLSISEISVLELPISLSDLYDPIPYQQLSIGKQARRRINWSSRGRLHRAIHEDNTLIFRTLLNLGADPEETYDDCPLLVYTARAPADKIIFCRLLLDRGANVDATDSSGRTLLSYCAELGSNSICELLLDRGATVDVTDSNGCTPLLYCTQHESNSICKLLLDRGAMVDATDSSGHTLLSHCAERRNYLICELLLDRGASADVDAADSSGRTLLSYCAELGSKSICKLLLDRGAAIDLADSSGRTPLSYCAELNQFHLCNLLLDRGGNSHLADVKGHTPLWYACSRGRGKSSPIYMLFLGRAL